LPLGSPACRAPWASTSSLPIVITAYLFLLILMLERLNHKLIKIQKDGTGNRNLTY
jgi:hypothetical protein